MVNHTSSEVGYKENFPVNKKNSAVISTTDLSHPERTKPRALGFNPEGTFCASV